MANVAGTTVAYPTALGLHYAFDRGGPMPKPTSTADYEILKRINPDPEHLPPEVLTLLAELPATAGMNLVGKGLAFGASALSRTAAADALRSTPGIKQALEIYKPGSSLPTRYREGSQDIIRAAEGEANYQGFLRQQALGKYLDAPDDVKTRVATAIEKRTESLLAPEERAMADALKQEYANRVEQRVGASIRANELGAHIPGLERKAETARLSFQVQPDRLNKAKLRLAEMRLQRATQGVPADQRVAFIDRPLTREARIESGLKPYGDVQPGGLGTGRMGRRIANPGKTTEEINQGLVAEGKQPIPDVVTSAFMAGEANDVRVMNAKIVKNLAEKFGEPTNAEQEAMKKHLSVLTGFDPATKAKLSMTKLPPQVDELVANLNKRLQPGDWQGFTNAWRGANNEFKKWALFSPGFISRNIQNNIFQQVLFGNYGTKGEYAIATKVANAVRTGQGMGDLISVGGKDVSVGEYIKGAFGRRVIGGGQTASEIGKTGVPLMKQSRDINQAAENWARVAFDVYSQNQGMAPMKAADRVDQILFNYSVKTAHPAKNWIRRNAIPFINWSSQVGPLVARTAIERPGSMGFVSNIGQRQNERVGYGSPEDIAMLGRDVAEQGGIVRKVENGKATAIIPQAVGQLSLNEYIPESPTPEAAFDQFARNTYPQMSVPMALGAGRDPLTGKPFTNAPATAPSALKALWLLPGGKEWAQKLHIVVDENGTVKAPDRVAFVLRSIPQGRLPSLVADIVNPRKGTGRSLLSFLVGYREVEREPDLGRSITARKAVEGVKERSKLQRKWLQLEEGQNVQR